MWTQFCDWIESFFNKGVPTCLIDLRISNEDAHDLLIHCHCMQHGHWGNSKIDIWFHPEGYAEIMDFRLDESHRGVGFGRRMLREGLRKAFNRVDTVIAHVSQSDLNKSPWLLDMYQKIGFTFETSIDPKFVWRGKLHKSDWRGRHSSQQLHLD